jgi:anti-sigma-K factor RskA
MTRPDPDLDRLAGEYVLGLTDVVETARAERMEAENEEFRAAAAYWRGRLGELDELAAPVAPSAELWSRIEAGIDAPVAQAAPAAASPVVMEDRASAFSALWRSLAFWRAASLAGALAALLLAVGVPGLVGRGERPVFVAVLMSDGNRPSAVVHAFADGRADLIPLQDIAVPQGRALEVWTVADPAQGPVSIGLLDRVRTIRLNLATLPRPGANQIFEISLEPERGSPTGKPTGPVLMKGVTSPTL